eukprot:SAG31_NODE_788_length_12088_cov_3.916090_2_plen_109_part_00
MLSAPFGCRDAAAAGSRSMRASAMTNEGNVVGRYLCLNCMAYLLCFCMLNSDSVLNLVSRFSLRRVPVHLLPITCTQRFINKPGVAPFSLKLLNVPRGTCRILLSGYE